MGARVSVPRQTRRSYIACSRANSEDCHGMSSMPKGYVQVYGARTKGGTACRRTAMHGRARCRSHADRPGAPTGRMNGRYVHGWRTKEFIVRRAYTTERLRWARHVLRLCGEKLRSP